LDVTAGHDVFIKRNPHLHMLPNVMRFFSNQIEYLKGDCLPIFHQLPPFQPVALRNKKSTMRIVLHKTCTKLTLNLQILHETPIFLLKLLFVPR
jgi:hypothetical protein